MRIHLDVVRDSGPPSTLLVDAPSPELARQTAMTDGYTVLRCRPVGAVWQRGSSRRGARSRRFDVLVFVEQLRDLLVAGLSVIEALDALRRGAVGPAARSIAVLERSLRNGQPLSTALAQQPDFPALLVALVRASEWTSQLPQTLTRYVEHEQRVAEVRHKLVSAAIYPALLLGVGTLVLLFLFFYVMPRFARVFDGMTGELPWSAQAMVAWSGLLSAHGPTLLAVVVIAVTAVVAVGASATARAAIWRQFLGWSPVKARMTTYFLARWYRATGMLVSGGIPCPRPWACPILSSRSPCARPACGWSVACATASRPRPRMSPPGWPRRSPSNCCSRASAPVTSAMSSARIAQFHESDVRRALERSMRALEPLVMIAIGLGVGVVVVLMYMPIFELASSIQ